jgi:hypothetical protein
MFGPVKIRPLEYSKKYIIKLLKCPDIKMRLWGLFDKN